MEEEEREELREETSGDFEHQRRENGTQVFKEPYSEGAIERLKHLIKISYQEGKNRFYAILIDGEKVVGKTSDVRKFDTYLKYRNPFTKVITVLMYKGYSFNCNRYEFLVSQGLSGASGYSQQEQVQKAIAEFKRAHEHEAMQRVLKKKTKKLKELKAIMEKIEDEKESGFDFEKVTGMVGQALGLVQQIKGGGQPALNGVPEPEPEDDEIMLEPISESEEKPKKKKKKSEEELLFNPLFNEKGSEQIIEIVTFMQNMSKHPDLSKKFQQELDNRTNK